MPQIRASILIALVVLGLVTRLIYLQVIEFEKYEIKSNKNRIQVEPIPPKRGLIYDRNGILLAENRSVYTLEIIPEKSDDLDLTIENISKVLPVSAKEIERFKESLKANFIGIFFQKEDKREFFSRNFRLGMREMR